MHTHNFRQQGTAFTPSTFDHDESLPTVVDTRGAWDLSGSVFIGDVRVITEEGKLKWLSGEHAHGDYNWDGHWNP